MIFNTDLSNMMPAPSSHGAMECGRVKLSDREVSNMWCGKRNFGYICQIEGNLSSILVCRFGFLNVSASCIESNKMKKILTEKKYCYEAQTCSYEAISRWFFTYHPIYVVSCIILTYSYCLMYSYF